MRTEFRLSAGGFELNGNENWSTLKVHYNSSVSRTIDIRSTDELYALQYIVNRAIQKIEQGVISKWTQSSG